MFDNKYEPVEMNSIVQAFVINDLQWIANKASKTMTATDSDKIRAALKTIDNKIQAIYVTLDEGDNSGTKDSN